SVPRLQEMKAFMRMSCGRNLRELGWNGDGGARDGESLASMPGIVRDSDGSLQFTSWNCRGGQNNVIVRTDGTVGPCFPMYAATYDWGTIDGHKFDAKQLEGMKQSCQKHCFSTLNHNLAYCYNDARVIKWLWKQAASGLKSGARSFDD